MNKSTPRFLLYFLPGLGGILWLSAFFGVIALGPQMMNVDGDLGRHLTIGQYILDQGKIPFTDLFSHTMPGQPVTPHEWLAQVIFALANRVMRLDGVILTCALVIATSFWLVFRRARQASQGLLVAVLAAILAIAASSLHWLSRPHIFTFLMLALWMNLLEDMRWGRLRRWWLMPVLMAVWANLHGAFIAGFFTWGFYGAGLAWDALTRRFPKGESLHGHFWRYYLLGGVLSFIATLANPSGFHLWGTSVGYIGNRYLVSHTMEYLPPNFHDPSTWPFLVFIGLLVISFGLCSKRIEAGQLFLVSAWLMMALYSVRNVPLFAIISAPVLATGLQDWLHASRPQGKLFPRLHSLDQRLLATDRSLRGLLWPALSLLFVVLCFNANVHLDFQQRGNEFDSQVFPVEAVAWLKDHPQEGEMFNYFPWGGYLLYRLWPDHRVFIDGQTDFYGEDFTRQYEKVISLSDGWQEVLDQYQVGWVILPRGEALTQQIQSDPGWLTVYEDNVAAIFSRKFE